MTFEQLLGDNPRQSLTQWTARAEKEWRGRLADEFAIELDGRTAVPPYFPTGGERHAVPRPARPTWVQLSDLRGADTGSLRATAAEELAGGAQGFCLDSTQLVGLASANPAVRYDYLTLCVLGSAPVIERELAQVVPSGQRTGLRLVTDPIVVGASHEVSAILREGLSEFETGFSGSRSAQSIMLDIPSDYLQAITLCGAADLLWANVAATGYNADVSSVDVRDASEAIPPLRIVAAIRPTDATSSPEGYLVDASVRAVAAVSAGIDALLVTPYSERAEHRRQARNLSHLLQLEAGLHDFGEALQGAAWFEEATVALASSVWEGAQPGA